MTSFLMTSKCHEEFFYNFNFLNVDCLKMTISKGLGYGILAGSMLLRVPQILKIVQAQSAQGISIISEVLTLIAIFGTMAYGFHNQFSIAAYGDSYFLYAQGIIVLLLVLFYQNKLIQTVLYLPVIAASSALLFMNLIPADVIFLLNGLNIFLSVISKLIQAGENYRNGSTGALSAITLILQFAGCVARIFTSIQETGDMYMVVTFLVNSVANGILVFQLVYYWNAKSKQAQAKKQKHKKAD